MQFRVWIYDPEYPWRGNERSESPSQPRGAPLHYPAFYGLLDVVRFLVIKYPQDVNVTGLDYDGTPYLGHLETGMWRSFKSFWKMVQMRKPVTTRIGLLCIGRRNVDAWKSCRSFSSMARMQKPRTIADELRCIGRRDVGLRMCVVSREAGGKMGGSREKVRGAKQSRGN